MRYKEWILLLIIAGLGIITANFVGFKASFLESLPGTLVLLAISLVGVVMSKIIPLKLPMIAYCSIVGLLVACPISPVASFVIESTSAINFTAPLTLVGAFAGISVGSELKTFATQGWKMVVIALLVMTGTYIGSTTVSHLILTFTGAV